MKDISGMYLVSETYYNIVTNKM